MTKVPGKILIFFQAYKSFLSRHPVVSLILNILWPLLIFLWVVFINRFPQGYIYVSGDFAQPINIENIFKNLFYTWGNGISAPSEGGFFSWFAASPYYFIFYLLPHKLGLNDTNILSYVLFLFLSLSYFSFLLALKLIFKEKLTVFTRVFSLIYSINLTTIYFYTYTWGFSHQVFLYITLPLLGAVFYRYISKPSLNNTLAFLVLLFLSIPGFTNVAFFVSLCLFFCLFLAFSILLKVVVINRKLVLSLLILSILSLLTLSVWVAPTYMALRGELSSLAGGMFNFNLWLRTQSADILSILIGLPGYGGFFPFSHNRWFLYLFPFIPILLLVVFLIKSKNEPAVLRKRLSLVLLSICVIFMFLIKKGQGPFGELTLKVFSVIPLLSIFRSYEKIALFMPFLMLTAIYGLIPLKFTANKYIYVVLVATLFAGAPFLMGGIQTKYSITLGDDPTKDYTTSKYSGLVKIPSDYYKIADIVNADTQDSKVQDLPFSVLNTPAWVNYIKWKLIGFNVTQNLLVKPTIGQNASQLNLFNWSPTAEFNGTRLNPEWYIKLLSYFNVSHLIYHKGVADQFISQSLPKVQELEKEGLISNLYDGESASLYKVDDKYVLPSFYVPKETLFVYDELRFFPYLLLVPDYDKQTNYLFKEVNKPTLDEQNTKTVVILEELISLDTLMDNTWSPAWVWPPQNDSKDQVDIQLLNIVRVAFEMKSQNLYHNQPLQGEIAFALQGLKLAVEEELKTRTQVTERNKIIEKVLKNLIMVNVEYGDQGDVHNFFLSLLYNFDSWALVKGCMFSCYPMEIPETGDYEILVENLDDAAKNARIYFKDRNTGATLSGEATQNLSKSNNDYVNYGVISFTKGNSLFLDFYHRSQIFLKMSEWKKETVDGKNSISRELLNLEPNRRYQVSIKYNGDLDSVSFTIVEDSSVPNASVLQLGEILKKTGQDPFFFAGNVGGTSKLYLYNKDGKDINSLDIGDIRVEEIFSPKIILKQTKTSIGTSPESPEIQIKKVNPTKYLILVSKATGPYSLVFSESFHSQWKLYLKGKEIAKDNHFVANGYANYWVINPQDTENLSSYDLVVEYRPQILFYYGAIISLSTLFLLFLVLCLRKIIQKGKTYE